MELSRAAKISMGMENSLTEIMRFFADDPQHPLKDNEFAEFWKSLTDEEKDEFRHANLGKKSHSYGD